jgi:importin subunit alpha-6/7
MSLLIDIARSSQIDPDVKAEACWAVLNATSCGTPTQIEYLVQCGSVSVFGDMLTDITMGSMALEGLERILGELYRGERIMLIGAIKMLLIV